MQNRDEELSLADEMLEMETPPPHPFWDYELGLGATPRLLMGGVLVIALFAWGGFFS
jgi:hypothetical protein